ncbi:hypothetical protein E2C01_040901 [Portunus trituberculatus]|uniref:Uncharacterized protein n=1 Tax=Portunus trituberculatus TaxID=210409 RepID=A0A5B7FNU8_PORTR|nr:hypothetical protein [Portunus trituberculatus]
MIGGGLAEGGVHVGRGLEGPAEGYAAGSRCFPTAPPPITGPVFSPRCDAVLLLCLPGGLEDLSACVCLRDVTGRLREITGRGDPPPHHRHLARHPQHRTLCSRPQGETPAVAGSASTLAAPVCVRPCAPADTLIISLTT